MGRITRALSALANRIKADRGASDINEMEHLQPLGDDSKPLPQDDGWSDRTNENGGDVYFGAFDYDNKVTAPGEKRIYGRNADGEVVNQVWLKGDGEIISSNDNCSVTQRPDGTVISTNGTGTHTVNPDGSIESVNGSGFIRLLADGSVNINGFIIAVNGAATSPVSVGAPIITSSTMTADGSGVSMGGDIVINDENYNDHTHSPGSYTAGGDPVTGNSGGKV